MTRPVCSPQVSTTEFLVLDLYINSDSIINESSLCLPPPFLRCCCYCTACFWRYCLLLLLMMLLLLASTSTYCPDYLPSGSISHRTRIPHRQRRWRLQPHLSTRRPHHVLRIARGRSGHVSKDQPGREKPLVGETIDAVTVGGIGGHVSPVTDGLFCGHPLVALFHPCGDVGVG